jgi:hypothetical protein
MVGILIYACAHRREHNTKKTEADMESEIKLNALVYDDLEAVDFITERTSASMEDVQRFLDAKTRYEMLIGTFPVKEEDNEQIQEERKLHADLLSGGESKVVEENISLLLSYVCRTTGLQAKIVADMIAEETAYMVQTRIMDQEAYDDIREWADAKKRL